MNFSPPPKYNFARFLLTASSFRLLSQSLREAKQYVSDSDFRIKMSARVEPAVGSCGHLQDVNTVGKASEPQSCRSPITLFIESDS